MATSIIIGLTADERSYHERQLTIAHPSLEGDEQAIEDALQAIATLAFRAALDQAVIERSAAEAQAAHAAAMEAENLKRQEREAAATTVLRPVVNPFAPPEPDPEPVPEMVPAERIEGNTDEPAE